MKAVYIMGSTLVLVGSALAGQVTLEPSKDNTLYESDKGDLSNGIGDHFFAGTTGVPAIRRGLLAFDVASAVPAGATIDSVSLTMTVSRSISGDVPVALHRALADWGEGASDAPANEGGGAPAAPGDATWIHTFSPGQFWASAGGDFAATPSATIPVGFEAAYTWSSAQMATDAQGWLDDPGQNFGWVVIGDESTSSTSKRFESRENGAVSARPTLTIEFTEAPAVPATTTVGVGTLALLLALAGAWTVRRVIA